MSAYRIVSACAPVLGALAPFAVEAQETEAIPEIAQALLSAAYETGDADEIAAVAKAVKTVFPDYEAAIDEQTAARLAAIEPAETADDEAVLLEETPPPSGGVLAVRPWDGKINASAVFSSGNSENSAVGFALDAARATGDFVHNVTGFLDLGRSGGVTNQKRWGAAYQLDYQLSERTYAYWRISYEEDEFSGFDYRLFTGAGFGHFFFQADDFAWKIEGGPGFRYSPIDLTQEVDEQLAVYAASEIDWLIREGVTLEQDVNVTWTSPTTTVQSITALRTKLTDSISTALSFEYRYETDPPEGRENTDTIARASLVYGF